MSATNKYGELEGNVCPACGDSIEPEWKACPKCGNSFVQVSRKKTVAKTAIGNRSNYSGIEPSIEFGKAQIIAILLSIATIIGVVVFAGKDSEKQEQRAVLWNDQYRTQDGQKWSELIAFLKRKGVSEIVVDSGTWSRQGQAILSRFEGSDIAVLGNNSSYSRPGGKHFLSIRRISERHPGSHEGPVWNVQVDAPDRNSIWIEQFRSITPAK